MNNDSRLSKHVPRLLHNGDIIHLIPPTLRRAVDGSLCNEVARNSFMVMLFLQTSLSSNIIEKSALQQSLSLLQKQVKMQSII